VRRVKSGIEVIDNNIEGGFPLGFNIMIHGEPGTGKSLVIQEIAHNFMKEDFYCIFISTDRNLDDFLDETSKYNNSFRNFWKEGRLIFIDAHSWKSAIKMPKKDTSGVSFSVSLQQLTSLGILLSEIRKKLENRRVIEIFDCVSELFLWTKEDEVILRFLSSFCSKTRSLNHLSFFVVEKGMQRESMLSSMNSIFQGSLFLGIEGTKRFLQIKKMSSTDYSLDKIYFKLSKEGGILKFDNLEEKKQ